MTIYETEVPGVGKRFEVDTGENERLVVIIHHNGKRELFRRPNTDADAEKLFDLTSEEAREVATVLEGADFQPLDIESLDLPLGEAFIEWIDVPGDSPLAGQTLRDAQVGERTGATVAAIHRENETIGSPEATTTLEPGDTLIVIGDRADHRALKSLLEAGSIE